MAAANSARSTASGHKMSDFSSVYESSDSDGETEPAKNFHRRISTNREIKTLVSMLYNSLTLTKIAHLACITDRNFWMAMGASDFAIRWLHRKVIRSAWHLNEV